MSDKWMPGVGSVIAVFLPQEIVRGEVMRYLDDDTMEAKLNMQPPMAKAHSYRFKQTVKLTRQKAEPTGERWMTEDAINDE